MKNNKLPFLLFLLVLGVLFSCSQKNDYSPELENALKLAGENRAELEKVLDHYLNPKDSLKRKAAEFLIRSMHQKHCYVSFVVADSNDVEVPFNVLDYKDYNDLLNHWDSLEENHGKLHFMRNKKVLDRETLSADYLIKNIDLAFQTWNYPWAKQLSFNEFCEYVLPYRSSNEPIEDWRPHFLEEYKWLSDSMKNSDDPLRACSLINNEIRSWFRFDERFYEHPTDQGMSEILEGKMGRCEDMTNIAIYAMRAWGIPVMSDFTPYWANTGNNHAWNAVLDKNGKTIIFMGGEANPGEYHLSNIFAKVYRKTFSVQAQSIMSIKKDYEEVPAYLNSPTIKDVTSEYTRTFPLEIQFTVDPPDSVEFAYLCVFNSGEWKEIAWAKIDGDKATFENMGAGIAYLPAFYKDGKTLPAGPAFILEKNGQYRALSPGDKSLSASLLSTTKRTSGQTTDNIGIGNLTNDDVYSLFFWDGKWKELQHKKVINNKLEVNELPNNALFWLVKDDSRKEERIFTLQDGKQIWW